MIRLRRTLKGRNTLTERTAMKLTYWYAPCLRDSNCYSIRATTKKECARLYEEATTDDKKTCPSFGPPRKVTVEYASGFDLMLECSTEGQGWWEHRARTEPEF